ncbi:MAG TPA: permease prefix domain 2-containing transporter, partial [Gemmatimonadaceae bacterium]
MTERRPPRLAVKLLDALLPAESREIVIGDLVETFEADAAVRPVAAYLRFWKEALAALVPLQFTPQ